jgi:hypothetical protein
MACDQQTGIGRVIRHALGEEFCMSNYLTIGGWSGRRKIQVDIIGETPEGFEIKALEPVFLPGRGILKKGQSTLVPKRLVKVEDGD